MSVLRKSLVNSPSLVFPSIRRRFFTTQNPNSTYASPEKPTSASYDDRINAAGRQRDFAAIHHLLNKRFDDGCFNTNNTFKFVSADLSVLDGLLQTLARLEKGYARKGAYDSLVARLSKMQRTEDALRVVDHMIRGGRGCADACTFHPILSCLTRKKKMEEAWRVMDLMREKEIARDLTSYNYLLTAYCVIGDLAAAAGVLTRIGEEGMVGDSKTYDALVLGACKVGKVEGALRIVRRMVEDDDDGIEVLYATHAHVIGSLLRLGYYAQAVEFVMSFAGKKKGLDTENFGLLCRRLISLEKLEEAKFVLGEMKTRDLAMVEDLKKFYDQLHVFEIKF